MGTPCFVIATWHVLTVLVLLIGGYVIGRYHGAAKVYRDQHNARVNMTRSQNSTLI